jgi:hypothetical protein
MDFLDATGAGQLHHHQGDGKVIVIGPGRAVHGY